MKGFSKILSLGAVLVLCLLVGIRADAASTKESADTITLDGGSTMGRMIGNNEDEVYWYKVTIPENVGNRWISFVCNNYGGESIFFDVYDESLTRVKTGEIWSNDTKKYRCKVGDSGMCENIPTVIPGKIYYLKVSTNIGWSKGEYSVQVVSESDDNWGTLAKAQEISLGKGISGCLEYRDDQDYFSFVMPNDGLKYDISFAGNDRYYARILNSAGTEVFSSNVGDDWGGGTANTLLVGNGAKYYVTIAYGNSERLTYNLGISLVKQNISKLSVKAKKNSKKVTISTIKGAKVKVTLSKRIIKNGKKRVKTITKTTSSGKFTLKLSSKLKKRYKIKVTVWKAGYNTKTKTIRIK